MSLSDRVRPAIPVRVPRAVDEQTLRTGDLRVACGWLVRPCSLTWPCLVASDRPFARRPRPRSQRSAFPLARAAEAKPGWSGENAPFTDAATPNTRARWLCRQARFTEELGVQRGDRPAAARGWHAPGGAKAWSYLCRPPTASPRRSLRRPRGPDKTRVPGMRTRSGACTFRQRIEN